KGFSVSDTGSNVRKDAFWFGEGQGRAVVSVASGDARAMEDYLHQQGVPFMAIGTVTDGNIEVDGETWNRIQYWKNLYETSISNTLTGAGASEAMLDVK
ncbi:MAG TPA: phosphoribosylformylglycinamidine synthase subunit PurL, partial [Ferruginibacter sp.]|nr:phosphoribosylformylglycinamidine synthase subunit PurL [Ferruginibacter sp.]